MGTTGIQRKSKINTLKQQRESAELELIIEDFGRAMRQANRAFMALPSSCHHDTGPRFTPHMDTVWNQYIAFCIDHPQ